MSYKRPFFFLTLSCSRNKLAALFEQVQDQGTIEEVKKVPGKASKSIVIFIMDE